VQHPVTIGDADRPDIDDTTFHVTIAADDDRDR
jgi:hypothetical protein